MEFKVNSCLGWSTERICVNITRMEFKEQNKDVKFIPSGCKYNQNGI